MLAVVVPEKSAPTSPGEEWRVVRDAATWLGIVLLAGLAFSRIRRKRD